MRIITLNAWCGRALYPLMKFVEKYADTTDVFCFQEVFDTSQDKVDSRHPNEHLCGNLFDKLGQVLESCDFMGFFAPRPQGPNRMSQAMFWNQRLMTNGFGFGSHVIFEPAETAGAPTDAPSSRVAQYLTVERSGRGWIHIINYHGLWNGGHKRDCPERLLQSEHLNELAASLGGSTVLCGDMNLDPDTEAIALLARDRVNLISEYYTVPSTRTPLYRHLNDSDYSQAADYVIVSPDLTVRSFEKLPDIASDHMPLRVEIAD